MLCSDVITLLSSDEEVEISPPKKKIKLISLPQLKPDNISTPSTSKSDEGATCVISSDDDDELVNKKITNVNGFVATDNFNTKNTPKEKRYSKPSINTIQNGTCYHDQTDITKLFNEFLKKCQENLRIPNQKKAVDEKLEYMQDAFEKYLHFTNDSGSFQDSLQFNLDNIANKPQHCLIYFTDIYQLLKVKLRDVTEAKQAIAGKERIIKKLERVLTKLKKKIDKLDEAECNFDDEENSTYLQVARYKQRATEIHAKLCKYRKVNQFSGRITYQRLKFNKSKYSEINEAINEKYKNTTIFPSYHEMFKLITNCVKKCDIAMSDLDIKIETKKCFEQLGNFIQKQRKLELYSIHTDYIIDMLDDPAKDDPVLQGKLLDSYQIKVEKESEILEKFCTMQEKGIKCDESEEASDVNSDCDNNENDGKEANENMDCITID